MVKDIIGKNQTEINFKDVNVQVSSYQIETVQRLMGIKQTQAVFNLQTEIPGSIKYSVQRRD